MWCAIRITHSWYSAMVAFRSYRGCAAILRKRKSHAHVAGELITQLGGVPSLEIGPLLNEPANDVGVILEESLRHEDTALSRIRRIARGGSKGVRSCSKSMQPASSATRPVMLVT